jgi:hypothetical protein
MAKVKITKEEADRLMKIKGKIRGSLLNSSFRVILDKEGAKGLKKLEGKMKKFGYPLKLKEISSFKWYPYAYSSLALLAMIEIFDWDESEAFEIGYTVPSYSVLAKLMMKYISPERLFTDGFKYWKKYFDFGDLKCINFDGKRKLGILRIENFRKFHPLDYDLIKGSLTKLIEMVTKSKNVKVEQTKSLFNDDSYDEFRIIW